MRFPQVLIVFGILCVVGAAYYLLSPLWRVVEINDAVPEGLSDQSVSSATSTDIRDGAMKDEIGEATPAPEQPVTVSRESVSYSVMATPGHPASGSVRVLEGAEGSIIRYENFETINGPNLHVYLAKGLNAEEYIDLGPIKGTKGNINYTVSAEIDLSDYRYVMYWCVPFKVLFNYAEIN